MASKTKPERAVELTLSASDRAAIEKFARVLRKFREIDPDYMTATRMEIFLNVALHPARSLKEHGLALGLSELNAYRNGTYWAPVNHKRNPGYDLVVEEEGSER